MTPERLLKIARTAMMMEEGGLPAEFVTAAMKLAEREEGVFDLMELWRKASSPHDRDQLVADLQDMIDDYAEAPNAPPLAKPRIDFDHLDGILKNIKGHKNRLRALIDAHGGVSAVARKAGIPQPSLSRMLNSGSMPRRTTLYRIANALDLEESDIVGEWVR